MKNKFIYAAIVVAYISIVFGYSSLVDIKPNFVIRSTDFENIQSALRKYHEKNHAYPTSSPGKLFVGKSTGEDWIPGIVPTYLDHLPNDPNQNGVINRFYLYLSDGQDYKIVAHNPEDIDTVAQSNLSILDPRRNKFAYGYWTENAAMW
jgi:hypothetical protein